MKRWFTALALAISLALSAAGAAGQTVAQERVAKIKSAYLLNFLRYTKWPTHAFSDAASPLTVCVVGVDSLGRTLELTMSGQTVSNRPVAIRRYVSGDELRRHTNASCHLIFLSSSELEGAPTLTEFDNTGMSLTVGETRSFVRFGAMLALNLENDRIVFYANRDAIRRAEVDLSSKLLQLARIVEPAAPGGGD